jgi:hypothetical protein
MLFNQIRCQESGKPGLTPIGKGLAMLIIAGLFILPVEIFAGDKSKPVNGPTAENALAAEQALTQALLANDAEAVGRLLDDDWAVISTDGGLGDGIRAAFLAAIKSGGFTRKTMVISEPRVRIYGNVAVVTTHLATSGLFGGKSFDVKEVQTDILIWRDGGWKSVLIHETKVKES